jgi:hypothetical protein
LVNTSFFTILLSSDLISKIAFLGFRLRLKLILGFDYSRVFFFLVMGVFYADSMRLTKLELIKFWK